MSATVLDKRKWRAGDLNSSKHNRGQPSHSHAPASARQRRREDGRGVDKEEAEEVESAEAIFQRHFEARFTPIASVGSKVRQKKKTRVEALDLKIQKLGKRGKNRGLGGIRGKGEENEDGNQSGGSEWDGVSDNEEADDEGLDGMEEESDSPPTVEIVDHSSADAAARNEALKDLSTRRERERELKAYLSSRPPPSASELREKQTAAAAAAASKKPAQQNQDEDSAALLANDLALQRLIAESHILSAAGGNQALYAGPSARSKKLGAEHSFSEGRVRRLTTDMRVRALGAKRSVFGQAKESVRIRMGTARAAAEREAKRRKEARESGVVLEREGGGGGGGTKQKGKKNMKKKGSGIEKSLGRVDMPGVGRMRGAELRLSARDVRAIEGPVRGLGGGGGKRRGGAGGLLSGGTARHGKKSR